MTSPELREARRLVAQDRREQAAKRRADRKARAPKPETVKRAKPTFGRERDNGFLAYLRRQPCRIGLVAPGACEGAVQACHVRYADAAKDKPVSGLQVKPSDRYATSCCAHHHREQHARGNERAWWASYGLDGLEQAALQFAAYQGGAI